MKLQKGILLLPLSLTVCSADFVPRGAGDRHGLKVLVFQSDDRPLHGSDGESHYLSITAVLNSLYCKHNGYDYLFLKATSPEISTLLSQYNVSNFGELSRKDKRYKASVFHPGFQRLRGQSWGKLLALLYVGRKYTSHYDYFMFLDPDLGMNPLLFNRSISDSLLLWQTGTSPINDSFVQWGHRNVSRASLILMTNAPWRDDLPNAGLILMKSGSGGLKAVSTWWNFNIPEKDTEEFHEQDALWQLLEANGGFSSGINQTTTCVIFEPIILSPFSHVKDMWAVHVPNYESNQLVYLRTLLHWLGLGDSGVFFANHVNLIEAGMSETFNLLAVSIAELSISMRFQKKISSARAMVRSGDEDRVWHSIGMSRLWNHEKHREKYFLKPVELLEGFTFRLGKDPTIFLCANFSIHQFLAYDSFHSGGYSRSRTLTLQNKGQLQTIFNWFDNIPVGLPLQQIGRIRNLTELQKMYTNQIEISSDERWFRDFPPIFQDGCAIKNLDHRSKEIFYMVNGSRHAIPNWDTFLSLKLCGPVTTLNGYQLDLIPLGDPIPPCNNC